MNWLSAFLPVTVSFVLTWIVLRVARRRAHLDVPNERSSHSIPTPRSGGIGIILGVVLCLGSASTDTYHFVGAVLVACGLGLWDDLRELRPRTKMVGLVAAAVLAALADRVRIVHGMPFVGDVDLAWAGVPLTVLWLACYPNALNFMDGLNGIASLTGAVSAAAFGLAFARHFGVGLLSADLGSDVAVLTALACVGFLPWNFPKARIFMGDAGSLPLGLLLAWCAVRANATGALAFPASILLLGPFMFDVTFTLVRRGMEGKVVGAPHKEHLYQRLSRRWNSHAKVSLLYAGFSVVTGVLALCYRDLDDVGQLLSLVLPTVAMLGFAALVLRSERVEVR